MNHKLELMFKQVLETAKEKLDNVDVLESIVLVLEATKNNVQDLYAKLFHVEARVQKIEDLKLKDGYTPIKGKDYTDGLKGDPGKDGYTPIKGKDYLDGKDGQPGSDGKDGTNGFDGKDGITPIKGTDYYTDQEVNSVIVTATQEAFKKIQIVSNAQNEFNKTQILDEIHKELDLRLPGLIISDEHIIELISKFKTGSKGSTWGSIVGDLKNQKDLVKFISDNGGSNGPETDPVYMRDKPNIATLNDRVGKLEYKGWWKVGSDYKIGDTIFEYKHDALEWLYIGDWADWKSTFKDTAEDNVTIFERNYYRCKQWFELGEFDPPNSDYWELLTETTDTWETGRNYIWGDTITRYGITYTCIYGHIADETNEPIAVLDADHYQGYFRTRMPYETYWRGNTVQQENIESKSCVCTVGHVSSFENEPQVINNGVWDIVFYADTPPSSLSKYINDVPYLHWAGYWTNDILYKVGDITCAYPSDAVYKTFVGDWANCTTWQSDLNYGCVVLHSGEYYISEKWQESPYYSDVFDLSIWKPMTSAGADNWVSGETYVVGMIIVKNGITYTCQKNHISDSSNEPKALDPTDTTCGVNRPLVDWETYWHGEILLYQNVLTLVEYCVQEHTSSIENNPLSPNSYTYWNDLFSIPQPLGYTAEDIVNKGQVNGYASLDVNGKIPITQLNPVAITNISIVPSEAAQLALDAQEGDVAVRTDLSESFMKNTGISGTMSDWTRLLSPTTPAETDPVYSADKSSIAFKTDLPDISGKVDKITGYGLSKNDFTDAISSRLANTSGNNTGDQTLPVKATYTELNTGSDDTKFVTSLGLKQSGYGKRVVEVILTDDNTAPTVATNFAAVKYIIPVELNGMNIIAVGAHVTTQSTSGLPTFQIYNMRLVHNVLTIALSIDANKSDTATSTTPAVIDTSYDDLVTGDELRFDCSIIGTGTKGVSIRFSAQLP